MAEFREKGWCASEIQRKKYRDAKTKNINHKVQKT